MAEQASKVPVKTEAKKTEPKAAADAPAERERHPLATLRQEMDRLFEDFASSWSLWPFGRARTESLWLLPSTWGLAAPAVDVSETDAAFLITAELPGLDEKNIELTLSGDVLTIKGEKSEEKEEKKKEYYLSERRYGSFQRSFQLPEGADADKVSAEFAKGVLKVSVPKTAEAQKAKARKIAVKTA